VQGCERQSPGPLVPRLSGGAVSRCLVPATSFCESTDKRIPKTGKKDWVWFALGEDRPLFAFAGIWRTWHGTCGTKSNLVGGEHKLYAFLTTEPNGVVRPVHSNAMPAILTRSDEFDASSCSGRSPTARYGS
jgi:putative SOS response-associated peptidase YedK